MVGAQAGWLKEDARLDWPRAGGPGRRAEQHWRGGQTAQQQQQVRILAEGEVRASGWPRAGGQADGAAHPEAGRRQGAWRATALPVAARGLAHLAGRVNAPPVGRESGHLCQHQEARPQASDARQEERPAADEAAHLGADQQLQVRREHGGHPQERAQRGRQAAAVAR